MVRTFLRIMLVLSSSLSLFDSSSWVYASSYTPGAEIALTGSSDEVFFDVADDIFIAGSTRSRPLLMTTSQ